MRKVIGAITIFLINILGIKIVFANEIDSIYMDIYVDNNGNAHINETWKAYLNEGTEGYKPYYNLGKSQITDFKVQMNNEEFTTLNSWNVDASFNSKKYRAGLHPIDDGVELCFGISEYGSNTYLLSYTITNFVARLDDADVIYWQLIPYELSSKPQYVYIKIYSDFLYDKDLPVWGYGNYGGYAYVHENGYVEIVHEDELDSDEYITALIKFPKNTFNTSNVYAESFDDWYARAEEGTTHYHDNEGLWAFIGAFISFIFNIGFFALIFGIVYYTAKHPKRGTKNLRFSKNAKKLKDVPYFRDIPCQKNIFKAYWIAAQYNLIKKETDFLGAILLLWIKNGNVQNITLENGKDKAIKLINSNNMSPKEVELYNMMYASSFDGVLETNEFTEWCKDNYSKILNWFNEMIDEVTMIYVSEGLIKEESSTFGKKYLVEDSMKEQAMEMAGLKAFLNDFSNIKDREAIEVHLWEYYLMYAQIFGIAKMVAKEFKRLYPDILTDDTYNDVIFIHTISAKGVSAASSARSRAESYSSGGGGFSSGGGGGGSFGGGGGGGGFR